MEFKSKWEYFELGQIAFIKGGKRLPKGVTFSNEKTGYPYIRVTDFTDDGTISDLDLKYISKSIHEQIKNYVISSEELYISIAGTIGKTGIIPDKLNGANFTENAAKLVFKSPSSISKKYIYFFTLSELFKEQIGIATKAVAMPKMALARLAKVKIPLPPLPEQTRIVAKLDSLFERIDKAIALLEENIRKTWELMEAVLGEVFDKGQVSLATACIFNPKKSEIKNLSEDLTVSFVPMADLNENQMYFQPRQEKALKEVYTGYTYFQDDDVLLAKVTPCFENGKAGIAKGLKNGIGFGSSEFHVLRPKEGVLSEWIYYAVSTRHLKEEGMKSFTGSSGLQRVPGKFLEAYMIQLPTKKKQEKIVNRINSLFDYAKSLQIAQSQKLRSLKSLKSSLLDQAFQGEL